MIRKKVFILGDSRTGTSSLNAFLNSLGISSKHYYTKESSQISPDHENRDLNWEHLKNYIENSGYDGFSDYPTRLYYKELHDAYPESYYILTVRESTDRWLKSMTGYFPKFGISLDENAIVKNYETINDEIESYFSAVGANFISVNIDDNDEEISRNIKSLLKSDSKNIIGRENTTEDIDIEDVSKRKILYRLEGNDWIDYIERVCMPSKVLMSEKGWLYLVNDSNDFFRWSYGVNKWTESEIIRVREIFSKRIEHLSNLNCYYMKYIVPEKSVVYSEFLPHICDDKALDTNRPACLMDKGCSDVHYLEKYLRSVKGFGPLYFKGDSHTNWLGAYYIYLHLVSEMHKFGLNVGKAIAFSELEANLANYKGDLYTQATEQQLTDIHGVWGQFNLGDSLGYDICYRANKDFEEVDCPAVYKELYGESRDVIVTESSDRSKPSAVIFRDSTCDFVQPFLSNHFSRAVYVWHKGNVYNELIEKEQPNIVVHMMAERFVSNYYQREAIN